MNLDLKSQELGFKAFYHVWLSSTHLHGVFFWNWWGLGGPQDSWYTLRGKPLLKEMKHFLKQWTLTKKKRE